MPLPTLSRRRLLASGLGGAVLVCGGGLSWLTLGYRLPEGEVAIGLSVKELCVVRALVEAMLPAESDLPSGLELGVHVRIDEEVWAGPDAVRADLSAALQLLEHLPPLFGHPGRLTSLSPARRLAFLEQALRHGPQPVVQAVVALKQMVHLFFYVHPRTWAAIGYDGPWVPEARPPASSRAYAELLAARRAG